MTIVEFYTQLSTYLGEYRINPNHKNTEMLNELVRNATKSGLIIDVNIDALMEATLDSEFDEVDTYGGDESYNSYDEDEDEDEDANIKK
jgi:hypothetical protein